MTRNGFGAALIVASIFASSAWAEDREIAVYTGAGEGATRPFTTRGPWEAQFTANAMYYLRAAENGQPIDSMGMLKAGPPGTYYSPVPGTYYIHVIAGGPWRIHIVEVDR